MARPALGAAVAALALAAAACAGDERAEHVDPPAEPAAVAAAPAQPGARGPGLLVGRARSIHGGAVPLRSFPGGAVLVVNTAIAARPGPAGEEPSWNFTKYLLDGEGRLVARFAPSVEPGDPLLVAAIDEVLAEPPL